MSFYGTFSAILLPFNIIAYLITKMYADLYAQVENSDDGKDISIALMMDEMWHTFDTDNNGVLDEEESKGFIKHILTHKGD